MEKAPQRTDRDILLVPLERELMESLLITSGFAAAKSISPPVGVESRVRAPVQCRLYAIIASQRVRKVVPSRLGDLVVCQR